MELLGKNINDITVDDITRLLENQIPESKTLEYKKELQYSTDGERKEFVADITAMANTGGGCIIYGIEEAKDAQIKNTGLPGQITGINALNHDKIKLQIEDTIRHNTDPAIATIAIHFVEVDKKTLLLIGVPRAYGLPVMVITKESNKFWRRKNAGKYLVGTSELNHMFLQNQVLQATAADWVDRRIAKVMTMGAFPVLNTDFPLFLHCFPYDFMEGKNLGFTQIPQELAQIFRPAWCGGWENIYNVDGYATFGKDQADLQRIVSYDQLFRNGIYECYAGSIFDKESGIHNNFVYRLDGHQFIKTVVGKLQAIFSIAATLKINPPFICYMHMFHTKGGAIKYNSRHTNPFLCNEIAFPPLTFQSFDEPIREKLQAWFTMLWQAAGQHDSGDMKL